jgi:hypothetical protein
MKRLLLFVLMLALLAVALLGYLGFVPVLATVFGSDRPRDLGVTWTQADLASARAKTGVRLESLPASTAAASSLVYEGQRAVNASFTGAELTALLNSSSWRYTPLQQVQIRIGDDGVIEGSGIVLLDRVDGYAAATGLSNKDVDAVLSRFSWVKTNPPVYFRAKAQVANGRLTGEIYELVVGRLPVPGNLIDQYSANAASFLQERFARIPGLRADQVTFSGGQMQLRGTLPAVEKSAP